MPAFLRVSTLAGSPATWANVLRLRIFFERDSSSGKPCMQRAAHQADSRSADSLATALVDQLAAT